MALERQISLLERAVAIERSSIRTNFKVALVVFLASIAGAFVVHIMTPSELGSAKLALTVVTGFGSFLSGIPIKDVASKRIKIECLCFLKAEYESFEANPDQERLAEVEKRFWTMFDKSI